MEDVLWCGFLKLHVPNQGYSIWLMGSIFVVVVGSDHQLRVLNGRSHKMGYAKMIIQGKDSYSDRRTLDYTREMALSFYAVVYLIPGPSW